MWLIVAIAGLFVYFCGDIVEGDGSGFKVVGWLMMFFGGLAFYLP